MHKLVLIGVRLVVLASLGQAVAAPAIPSTSDIPSTFS